MTDDLRDLLDASFGDGPTPVPPADRLVPARRSLRRRRLVSGVTGLAAALVAATAIAVVDGTGGGPSALDPAVGPTPDQPSATGTTTVTATDTATDTTPDTTPPSPPPPTVPTDSDVELAADGTLLRVPGVRVTERVEDPLGSVPPARSLGVAYTLDGEDYWALLEWEPDGGFTTWDPAGKSLATLQQWLDQMVALQEDRPGLRLVAFDRDGSERLRPRAGVRILDQTAEVDLPDFAAPGDRTAAAMVGFEGRRWFVLVRESDGTVDYLPTAGSIGGRSLAQFLDHAADQYASGEGLL